MKNKLLNIILLLMAAIGFTACEGDQALPPTYMPPLEGTGTGAHPYNVTQALINIYNGDYNPNKYYFIKGKVCKIDETSETAAYGNITYYISDDGQDKNSLEIYRGYGLNGEKFKAITDLKLGDEVIVYGRLTYYNDKYAETQQGAIIVSLNGSEYEYEDDIDPEGDGSAASPFNVIAALDFIYELTDNAKSDEFYVKGIISKVDESSYNASFGNITYYISVTGSTLTQLEVYRGLGLNGKKFTSATDIKVGDSVVLKGQAQYYNNNTPEMCQGTYIVSLNGSAYDNSSTDTPGAGGGDTPGGSGNGQTIYTGLNSGIDGWTLDNVVMDPALSYVWQWSTQYNCLKGSAFLNSTYYATEAYAYTTIDLAGYTGSAASFQHCYRFCSQPNELLTMVARVSGTTEWTKLVIPNYNDGSSFSFTASGPISLGAYDGKKIDLGFCYKSTTSEAATWEIKNFTVTGVK